MKSIASVVHCSNRLIRVRASGSLTPITWLSTSTLSGKVPDEHFDGEVEKEKEFLDIASSISSGGLDQVIVNKDSLTWGKLDAGRSSSIELSINSEERIKDNEVFIEDLPEDVTLSQRGKLLSSVYASEDVGNHMKGFRNQSFLPSDFLNYNLPWRKTDTIPDQQLSNFISHSQPERYGHASQGSRACPGKLQRRGKTGTLGCHKIDLDELDHMDIFTLRKFLSEDTEILGRKITGLCAKCQRQVAKSIKRARHFGILPHIGDYEVQEVRPYIKRDNFHDIVETERIINSKTVL